MLMGGCPKHRASSGCGSFSASPAHPSNMCLCLNIVLSNACSRCTPATPPPILASNTSTREHRFSVSFCSLLMSITSTWPVRESNWFVYFVTLKKWNVATSCLWQAWASMRQACSSGHACLQPFTQSYTLCCISNDRLYTLHCKPLLGMELRLVKLGLQ